MSLLFFLLFYFISITFAGIEGNAKVTSQTMGFVTASVKWEDGKFLDIIYTLPGESPYREIFDFTKPPNNYLYTDGGFCTPRCGQTKLSISLSTIAQAKAWTNTQQVTINDRTCTRHNAPNTNFVFTSISFDGDNKICDFKLNNGRIITFTSYNGNANLPNLVPPSDCGCVGGNIDIVFVFDRSGSIAKEKSQDAPFETEWPHVRSFAQEFITRLNFQDDPGIKPGEGANIGFSHFNTERWTTLKIANGVSRSTVTASYGETYNCLGQNQGSSGKYCDPQGALEKNPCCGGGTCIACAIREGRENLKGAKRNQVEKVMIVITDGNARNKRNGASCVNNIEDCLVEVREEKQTTINEIPGVKIIAVGVAADIDIYNLQTIATDNSLVFKVESFTELAETLQVLIATSCPSNTNPCGDDSCSFCACGERKQPQCDPGTHCTEIVQTEACCQKRTKPLNEACPAKLCSHAVCSEAEGCVYTPVSLSPCPGNTECRTVTCNVTTDSCVTTTNPECCERKEDCAVNDACTTYDCVSNKCVFNTIQCTPSHPCEIAVCDPNSGCQRKEKTCPPNTVCRTYTGCDETSGDCKFTINQVAGCVGECISDADCNDGNECTRDVCTSNSCVRTPIECDNTDVCKPHICIPESGCVAQPVTCRIGDDCTSYNCENVNGVAECVPKSNPNCATPCIENSDCVTSNKCVTSSCVQSKCSNRKTVCEPNFCANVACNPSTGNCDSTPFSADYCDDLNTCTDDSCIPSVGCVHINITCPNEGPDNCTIGVCDPVEGCRTVPRICADPDEAARIERCGGFLSENHTDPECRPGPPLKGKDCRTYLCEEGECVSLVVACADGVSAGAITGSVLGAGAIVGIVIALAVFFGAAGGGAYAANQYFSGGAQSDAMINPLYLNPKTEISNPLMA